MPNPPAQTWDQPGRYTVTLRVERGGLEDTIERTVTIERPPPTAPVVTEIRSNPDGPYNQRTSYEFLATVTSGPATPCRFVIDGTAQRLRPTLRRRGRLTGADLPPGRRPPHPARRG